MIEYLLYATATMVGFCMTRIYTETNPKLAIICGIFAIIFMLKTITYDLSKGKSKLKTNKSDEFLKSFGKNLNKDEEKLIKETFSYQLALISDTWNELLLEIIKDWTNKIKNIKLWWRKIR